MCVRGCAQVGNRELRVPGFMAKRLQSVRIRAWVLGFTVYSIVLRVVGAKIPQRRVEVQLMRRPIQSSLPSLAFLTRGPGRVQVLSYSPNLTRVPTIPDPST